MWAEMNKLQLLENIYNNPFLFIVAIFPAMSVLIYGYIIDKRYIQKKFIAPFTCFVFAFSFVIYFCILIYFDKEKISNTTCLFYVIVMHMMYIIFYFPFLEKAIRKMCFVTDEEYNRYNRPHLFEQPPQFYERCHLVYIISFITQSSLMLCILSMFVFTWLFIILHYMGFNPPALLLLGSGLGFFMVYYLSLCFLRPLVKCSNCKLDLLWPDDHGVLYCKILPRAIKEKILDCWHCGASYALDPKMNLDDVAEANKTSKVREMIFELREDKH